jgi:hypothetical protein
MTTTPRPVAFLLATFVSAALATGSSMEDAPRLGAQSAGSEREGQYDFDFNFGT